MSAVSWQEALRDALMAPKQGLESAIAARTGLQVVAPQDDQLTRQIWGVVERHRSELTGRLLDVGCYGGWLYPFVRHQADYHGIDIWPEAITAATRMWGPRFEERDVFTMEGKWDVVWCTQIIGVDVNLAWDKLRELGTKLVIYASPDIKVQLPQAQMYEHDVNTVAVWRA